MSVYITREQDYALRICVFLSGFKKKEVVPISTLAKSVVISRPIATKIVYQLKQHGIVGTTKGKNGGVYLQTKPNRIRMLDVLRAMGFNARINECLKIPGICPFHARCKVHHFFEKLNRILLTHFQRIKISDFLENES